MTFTTHIYHNEEAFTQLGAEWDHLAARGMTNTPFQKLAYQQSWWRRLSPGDLLAIALRRDDGSLAAIASFFINDRTLYFNGCVEESDYLDLIAPPAEAEAAWACIFELLASDETPDWQALDLCNVPEESPTRQILPPLVTSRGFLFETDIHDVCPVATLPADFEEYLESLAGKQRREIRRKLRKAQAAGARLETIGPENNLDAAVDDFLDLLQKSLPEKDSWLNAGRRAVFREVAHATLEEGILQLQFLQVEGQRAAALYNFAYQDRIWVYNSGLDPLTFGWLSPGVVLTALSIEKAIEDGCRLYDFLRGDEAYKYHFGAENTTVHRISVSKQGNEGE